MEITVRPTVENSNPVAFDLVILHTVFYNPHGWENQYTHLLCSVVQKVL